MPGGSFVAVRCPSCGSHDVSPDGRGFRCDHCESFFVRGVEPSPVVSVVHPRRGRGGGQGAVVAAAVLAVVAVGVGAVVVLRVASTDAPTIAAGDARAGNRPVEAAPQPAAVPRPVVPEPSEPEPVEPEPASEPEVPSASEPEPEPEPEPIVLAAFQPLSGCECKADLDGDGRPEPVQLAVKASAVGTWITSAGTSREYAFDFIVRSRKLEPIRLPVGERTAPPRRRRGEALALGMACEDDRLLFAADSVASGVSLRTGQIEWSTELPAPYTPRRMPPAGASLSIQCDRLRLGRERVTVRLPGGTVELSTADGSLVEGG